MKKFLLYLWQLPQNIVGLVVILFLRKDNIFKYRGKLVCYDTRLLGSISLGEYLAIGSVRQETLDHEYGHTKQSLYFGPLYLFIVGLWSLQEVWFDRDGDYYDDFPEKQADKYGGVIKDENNRRKCTYVPTAEELNSINKAKTNK